MTNQTAPIWNVIEEFEALKEEVSRTEWPIEFVPGSSDGIQETQPYLLDHKEYLLNQLDYYIINLQDAEQFYLKILKDLP